MKRNSQTIIKGYIGNPDPGFNPTMLGALIFNAYESSKKISKPKISYKHRYSRNPQTFNRILKSVELLRYKPKYSINYISDILGVSSRTTHVYIKKLYGLGFKAFNCMRNNLFIRSKNSASLHRLRRIFRAYIRGKIDILTLFDALGWDPP